MYITDKIIERKLLFMAIALARVMICWRKTSCALICVCFGERKFKHCRSQNLSSRPRTDSKRGKWGKIEVANGLQSACNRPIADENKPITGSIEPVASRLQTKTSRLQARLSLLQADCRRKQADYRLD